VLTALNSLTIESSAAGKFMGKMNSLTTESSAAGKFMGKKDK